MTFHALRLRPLIHDRTSDVLSRDPDHSFVRAQFKLGRDRCSRADRRLRAHVNSGLKGSSTPVLADTLCMNIHDRPGRKHSLTSTDGVCPCGRISRRVAMNR
jgi:hypothetical protein